MPSLILTVFHLLIHNTGPQVILQLICQTTGLAGWYGLKLLG
jgi:hypothetical protein